MAKYIDVEPYLDCKIVLNSEDPGMKVSEIPAADVIERKRGHWIVPVPGDGEPYCSECKKEAPTVGAFNMHSELTDFCPHCGADMKEDS